MAMDLHVMCSRTTLKNVAKSVTRATTSIIRARVPATMAATGISCQKIALYFYTTNEIWDKEQMGLISYPRVNWLHPRDIFERPRSSREEYKLYWKAECSEVWKRIWVLLMWRKEIFWRKSLKWGVCRMDWISGSFVLAKWKSLEFWSIGIFYWNHGRFRPPSLVEA